MSSSYVNAHHFTTYCAMVTQKQTNQKKLGDGGEESIVLSLFSVSVG